MKIIMKIIKEILYFEYGPLYPVLCSWKRDNPKEAIPFIGLVILDFLLILTEVYLILYC